MISTHELAKGLARMSTVGVFLTPAGRAQAQLHADFHKKSLQLAKYFNLPERVAAKRLREYVETHTCSLYEAFSIVPGTDPPRLCAAVDFIEAMRSPVELP